MKICSKCGLEKAPTEYYPKMGRCKQCHSQWVVDWQKRNPEKVKQAQNKWRAKEGSSQKEVEASLDWQRRNPEKAAFYRLKQNLKQYGITVEQFEEMEQAQNGLCFICGLKPPRRLDVDHCHTTGKVRKLLCSHCNALLGFARESIETLGKAITYLNLHKDE